MKPFYLFILFGLNLYSYSQVVYDFTLVNPENKSQSYEELNGEKFTIIDFWATWCKPCQLSIPKINKIYNEYKEKGIEVIGISIDNPRNRAKISPLIKALGIDYPVLLDTDQEVMQDFNVSSIPVLFIIDSNNKIIYTHEGYAPGDDIEIRKKLNELLSESE